MSRPPPFWKTKRLNEMTREEWESLCDRCGRCCLHKLRYEDTGTLSFTNVACRLLDLNSCRCSDYANRRRRVPDCVNLTPKALDAIDWLPPSCAYRRLGEGHDLAWWHPLVSGDPDTVHRAGISVQGRAVSEKHAGPLEHHIVDWPGRVPRPRKEVPLASPPPETCPPDRVPPEPLQPDGGRPGRPRPGLLRKEKL